MRQNHLAKNCRILRKKLGISQDALAGVMLINKGTILNWENGHSVPSVDYLIRLADVFGVSLDTLVCGEITDWSFADNDTGKSGLQSAT